MGYRPKEIAVAMNADMNNPERAAEFLLDPSKIPNPPTQLQSPTTRLQKFDAWGEMTKAQFELLKARYATYFDIGATTYLTVVMPTEIPEVNATPDMMVIYNQLKNSWEKAPTFGEAKLSPKYRAMRYHRLNSQTGRPPPSQLYFNTIRYSSDRFSFQPKNELADISFPCWDKSTDEVSRRTHKEDLTYRMRLHNEFPLKCARQPLPIGIGRPVSHFGSIHRAQKYIVLHRYSSTIQKPSVHSRTYRTFPMNKIKTTLSLTIDSPTTIVYRMKASTPPPDFKLDAQIKF
ncbi:MAG: hypothetical protein Q9213_002815 [Squamulea squamosa]